MEFIVEEIDINDEQITDDLDVDLGSSSHSQDWKLNPNVECRVILERMESFHNENKVHRDSDKNGEVEREKSSPLSVDKSCGIYRKLKLLVDVLKNCEKRENCGLCEKYIQQLQQHLLLTHGNNTGTAQERNSVEAEPVSLAPSDVPLDKEKSEVKMPHGDDAENLDDEFVPALTIGPDGEGEPSSHRNDSNQIQRKSISKGGKSKPFKCGTCGKGFLTFYDLTQHKRIHNAEARNPHDLNSKILQTQKKGFNSNSEVRRKCIEDSNYQTRHKRINKKKKPYVSDTCGKKFLRKGSLTIHKLVHAGLESYKCDVCGKCFTKKTLLTTHKLVHTGGTPHKCEVCGKFFSFRSLLVQHKICHYGEKPYRCEVCGKCFSRSDHLTYHKLIHTGEKPFRCEVCGKCFRCNSHLNQHKLIHTGEKPHRCELCGKCFTQSSQLTGHILTHTREKSYKCEPCGKCFASQKGFRRHKLIHTS